MTDTTTTDNALELLDLAIGNARNGVVNAITTRRMHPTFGITKAAIVAEQNQLFGLLYARRILTHGARSATFMVQVCEAADDLDLNIDALGVAVKGA